MKTGRGGEQRGETQNKECGEKGEGRSEALSRGREKGSVTNTLTWRRGKEGGRDGAREEERRVKQLATAAHFLSEEGIKKKILDFLPLISCHLPRFVLAKA